MQIYSILHSNTMYYAINSRNKPKQTACQSISLPQRINNQEIYKKMGDISAISKPDYGLATIPLLIF